MYSIYQGYQANNDYESKRERRLTYHIQQQIVEAYLQALHLETVLAFTNDTQRRLEHNQLKIAAFVEQDLLHPVEGLRMDKALAEVQLAELRATQGRALLLQQLELLLGQPIEPIPLETKPVITGDIDSSTSVKFQMSQLQRDALADTKPLLDSYSHRSPSRSENHYRRSRSPHSNGTAMSSVAIQVIFNGDRNFAQTSTIGS